MTDCFLKLVLRAFNGECDTAVAKVKYSNVKTMENRVNKAYKSLNKLSETTRCEITPKYLELKLQELYLTHEYQEQKKCEADEQRELREQRREEERERKEAKKAAREAEQEEQRSREALEKALSEGRLREEIEKLKSQLSNATEKRERAISRSQITKAGHV